MRALAESLGGDARNGGRRVEASDGEGYLRARSGGHVVAAPPLRAEEDPLAPFEAVARCRLLLRPPRRLVRLPIATCCACAVSRAWCRSRRASPRAAGARRGAAPGVSDVLLSRAQMRSRSAPPRAIGRCVPRWQRYSSSAASRSTRASCASPATASRASIWPPRSSSRWVRLVEQPNSRRARGVRARGARFIGVPIEADGLRVDALPSLNSATAPSCCTACRRTRTRRPQPEGGKTTRFAAHRHGLRCPDFEEDSAGFFTWTGRRRPRSRPTTTRGTSLSWPRSPAWRRRVPLGWLVAGRPVTTDWSRRITPVICRPTLDQRAVHRLACRRHPGRAPPTCSPGLSRTRDVSWTHSTAERVPAGSASTPRLAASTCARAPIRGTDLDRAVPQAVRRAWRLCPARSSTAGWRTSRRAAWRPPELLGAAAAGSDAGLSC